MKSVGSFGRVVVGAAGKGSGVAAVGGIGVVGPRRRSQRGVVNSRLPFWLVMLGLALVLGAFSQDGDDAGKGGRRANPLAFDLDGLPPTGSGGDAATRPSNRAFALLQADDGRFYAPYGPLSVGDDAGAAANGLAGVLVGDVQQDDSPHASANVHEFSIESGALRITPQEGRFVPSRFVSPRTAGGAGEWLAAAFDAAPASPLPGRYSGRLADPAGSAPATVRVGGDGALAIALEDGCTAHGRAVRHDSAALWRVDAVYADGCAQAGQALRGHAFARGDALFLVLPEADLSSGTLFAGQRD